MRWRGVLCLLFVPACAVPSRLGEPIPYRVIDRRDLDGTVLLVRRVARQPTGGTPFRSGRFWELRPSTRYFRVRDPHVSIPARRMKRTGDPPAVTLKEGKVVPNSWTTRFGGRPATFFRQGEIVHLVRLNTAFKTVRMDVESVCRPDDAETRPRGRVDFVLSGQVGADTFDEANATVGAVLEPMELSRVLETCEPSTGRPPLALRVGARFEEIRERLGPPRDTSAVGDAAVIDYGAIRLHVQDGAIIAIVVPAVD